MTLDTATSRARYIGNGVTTVFDFGFKVWDSSQLEISYQDQDGGVRLVTGECSISLSESGGTVTFAPNGNPMPTGTVLAIVRSMPFTQGDDYVSGSRFDPEVIETRFDKDAAERQQLLEKIERAVVVPATWDLETEVPFDQIINAKDEAVASAASANEAYAGASAALSATLAAQDVSVAAIQAAAGSQIARVEAEGDRQIVRLSSLVDLSGLSSGVACAEGTWILRADTVAGTSFVMPETVCYVVGRHHLRLYVDGVFLSPSWFAEVGDDGDVSHEFSLSIPLRAGQELHAWISPLGREDFTALVSRVSTLEDSLAELSRRVVYADNNVTE